MPHSSTSCPACSAAAQAGSGRIAFCDRCGHRWMVTDQQEHKAVEEETYTIDYSGYRPDERFIAVATAFTKDELATRIPPPAKLLDVGCGAGDFMTVAASLGYQVEGIDVSDASARICTQKGLKARAGDFLTDSFDHNFDVITMWDVVEHLQDPGAFLERARSLLADDGYIFAKIPSFGNLSVQLSNRVPAAAGALLGAPGHVQYFTRQSLGTLLERKGLEPQWVPMGHARSKMKGGSLKRRVARKVRSMIKTASGDANLYVFGAKGEAAERSQVSIAAK